MYDFYYASGWFSEEQTENYDKITSILKKKYTLFEPRYKVTEAEPNEKLTIERAKEIFTEDIEGINKCKAIFCDVSFRDSGVLVELGVAIAKNMPIVIFDNKRKYMNCMLAGSAQNVLRSFEDVEDFVNGKDVFNMNEIEIQ